MRFYRVHYYSHVEGSQGFVWHTSKEKADRAAAAWKKEKDEHPDPTISPGMYEDDRKPEVTAVDITPTKAGIQEALNAYASHPDNG